MPWNENGDGPKGSGPWGTGSNGSGSDDKDNVSPWKRPGGGNGGNGGQGGGGSDLEEQMRKMQERWRSRRGGRGGGGGGGGGASLGPLGFAVLAVVALFAWASTGVVVVDEGERAVIFQFGKYKTNFQPGFRMHLPAPIETHEIIPAQKQQTTRVESTTETLMLTGDENILEVPFLVRWYYDSINPEEFILNIEDGSPLVKAASESVMREVVGKSTLEQVLTTGKGDIQLAVLEQLQLLLNDYRAGVSISEVQLLDVAAPQPVAAAFTDVVNADQDAEKFVEEARRTANDIVPRARGDAQRILQEAEAYRAQVIADATGQASRFEQILSEYREAPQVTRERMYLETTEKILARSDKLLLDNESGALPYLPINPRTSRPVERPQ